MLPHRDLHKALRSKRAVFHLADFHVHSPASYDIRSGDRFEALSSDVRQALSAIPERLATQPVKYEEEVLKAFAPETFLDSLVARRDEVAGTFDKSHNAWSLLAITDHNVCRYSTKLAEVAFAKRHDTRLIVLPGIELDIEFTCVPTNDVATIHVLCLFRPGTTESDVRLAIASAGNDKPWSFGSKLLRVSDLPASIRAIRSNSTHPAICIAAHVSSSKGIQNETKKTILSSREAEISRYEGELDRLARESSPSEREKQDIAGHLTQLRTSVESESIAQDVLTLIGRCGFDALQVSALADGKHYLRLHRFREEDGRAVPIVASDAHRTEDIFQTGAGAPFLKLPRLDKTLSEVDVFEAVRRGLRYGETRITATPALPAQYWISGLEISPDADDAQRFWPVPGREPLPDSPKSFVLPFSRNLNTLIGGRGSGKSAVIEALAFVVQPDEFSEEGRKKERERDEFYERAAATLGGCNVRVCWQYTGGDLGEALPKQSCFTQRYFDPKHRHRGVEHWDADGRKLVQSQVPPGHLQIFRLGEIEEFADPRQLRVLFDKMCGDEVVEHEERIAGLLKQLANQRKQLRDVAKRVQELTVEESPLREYVERLDLFLSVNTKEMKEAYDELDKREAASNLITTIADECEEMLIADEFETMRADAQKLFAKITKRLKNGKGEPKPHLAECLGLFEYDASVAVSSAAQNVLDAIGSLKTRIDEFYEQLETVSESVAEKVKEAKNALQKKGLPTGSTDRAAKKEAYEEAKEELEEYRTALGEWEKLALERQDLRRQLVREGRDLSTLRTKTARSIDQQLRESIDREVLIIDVDARPQADRSLFEKWLADAFSGTNLKYHDQRAQSLGKQLDEPEILRDLLLNADATDAAVLVVDESGASAGGIDAGNASTLLQHWRALVRLDPEILEEDCDATVWKKVPKEIREGLVTFSGEDDVAVEFVLKLDEVVFDDLPVIRLNDRPKDPNATPLSIENLSRGQRCSAVLPILLLTGKGPLIIDQPEDNLDNKLIRQVIVNILARIKLQRQVIVATHNPNIPVLGDVENAIVLKGIGDRKCKVEAAGDLDNASLARHLTEVMEGGREAFQYRHAIYTEHWRGPVAESGDQ